MRGAVGVSFTRTRGFCGRRNDRQQLFRGHRSHAARASPKESARGSGWPPWPRTWLPTGRYQIRGHSPIIWLRAADRMNRHRKNWPIVLVAWTIALSSAVDAYEQPVHLLFTMYLSEAV